MSLLTIVQDAVDLCGLAADASVSNVIGSSDPTIREMRALAQLEGDTLARFDAWRGLKVLGQLTGDGISTEYSLPADFHSFAPGAVMWLANRPDQPLAMVTSDDLLALKSSGTDPADPVWRIFGDTIEFYPALQSGEVVNLEYRSKYWIVDQDGVTRKARWENDADYSIVPERLLMLGLVWRWRKTKGLDYGEDFRTYQIEVLTEKGVQEGRQTITMRDTFSAEIERMGRPAYYRITP